MSRDVSLSPPARGQAAAYTLAIASTAIWGSPPVVTRAVSGDVPPLALTFARWLITLSILLPIAWPKLRSEWPRLRPHLRSLTAVALFMTAGSTFSVIAVYFTTATNAVLVNAVQPAVTAVIAWAVGSERLTPRQGIGIGCAFFGVLVMICRADPGVLTSLDISVGDPIMLLAVVGWSLYAVNLHRQAYVPSAQVMLFVIALTGAAILLPLYLVEASLVGSFDWSAGVASAMLYLALFPTLLAIAFWNAALKTLGANRAAIFINLIPVFGAVLAIVFLDERLFAYHLLGAAFVFAGIYLAVQRRATLDRRSPNRHGR